MWSIIPEPRERPFWERTLYLMGVVFLATWKALHLPKSIWITPIRSILTNWTWGMFGVVIGSWVTRAYIDQPCVFNRHPEGLAPKAEVDPPYRLSTRELAFFFESGYIGPFDAFAEEEVNALVETMARKRQRRSSNFGIVTDRDLHLETPAMLQFMSNPAILERAAQLLGPDLLSWRSQLFFKPSGGREIQWHQASTYMMEDYLEPALIPPDRNELFQLTVWIALGPVTAENGALQFVPGSHDRIRTIHFGGPKGFYAVNFQLEFDVDPQKVVTLEMKAGQFVIFSERMVHGSGPNHTSAMRYAMNYRLIPTDVKVYQGQSHHRAMHMGNSYSLKNWGAVLLRGTDRFGYNKLAAVEAPRAASRAARS